MDTYRPQTGQGQDRISKTKQDPKDKTGHAQTITIKKSFCPKLPNTRTTILRNTAVSKLAVGLLNSSKDKIITVLTSQVELAAANAEIK